MKNLFFFSLLIVCSFSIHAQEYLPVPESLIVKNVPGITSEQYADFMKLMQVPDPSGDGYQLLDIGPDGQVYIIKNNQEVLVKPKGNEKLQPLDKKLSFGSDFSFFPDQQKAIYTKEEGAEEKIFLYIHDLAQDTLYKAYKPEQRLMSYLVAPDASFALVFEMNHPALDGTLYKLPLDGKASPEKISELEGYNQLQEFDKTLEHVYLINSKNSKDGKLLKVNLKTGEHTFVFEEEQHQEYFQERRTAFFDKLKRYDLFQNNSKALYARTGTQGNAQEFAVLWEVDHASGKKQRLSPDILGDVTQFELTADEQTVVYAMDFGGKRTLHLYDRQTKRSKVLYDRHFIFKSPKTFLLDKKEQKVYFFIYKEGVTELLELDLRNGQTVTVLQSEKAPVYDQVILEEFIVPVEDQTIGVMNGIPGFLYLPKDSSTKKLPVIVYFHGGPSSHTEALPLPVLEKGSAAIQLNYRGSTGYGVSFEKADNGFNRHKQIDDLKHIYTWIKEHPRLDENKIILFGGSWGGYMVLAAMTKFPNLFYAGFSGAGVSDLVSIATNDFFISWSSSEIGDVNDPKMLAYLIENSPYKQGKNIKRPLFLMHGSADVRVPIENTKKMIDAIEENGGNVKYVISKAGHRQGMGFEEMAYTYAALKAYIDGLIE